MRVVVGAVGESGIKLHGAGFSPGIKQKKPTQVRQGEHHFHETQMSALSGVRDTVTSRCSIQTWG